MYLLFLSTVCFCGTILAETAQYYEFEKAEQYFEEFMHQYGKQYANEYEKAARLEIFKENLEDVNRMNKESHYESLNGPRAIFGISQFMDLTLEEFNTMYTGLGDANFTYYRAKCKILRDRDIPNIQAPEAFDWRQKNAVTRVKQQGPCESCYTFSTTGHLEGQNAIKHGKLIELSEQQIVDCDNRSNGCRRGFMTYSLMSIMDLGGIMKATDYPYTAKDGKCRFNKNKVVLRVTDCFQYDLKSQEKLKQLLYKTGPISIAIKADGFRHYTGGVISDRTCSQGDLNHAVLLVGYGTDPKMGPYWIVKNSYDTTFGEKGYFRMQRGERATSCGVMNTYMVTASIA